MSSSYVPQPEEHSLGMQRLAKVGVMREKGGEPLIKFQMTSHVLNVSMGKSE
jgi:hypothetical protein